MAYTTELQNHHHTGHLDIQEHSFNESRLSSQQSKIALPVQQGGKAPVDQNPISGAKIAQ